MNVQLFRVETWELDELVRAIEPAANFLTRMFFGSGDVFSDAATIEWDIQEGGQRLAPFVSPYTPGVPVRSRGYIQAYFKPAYVKPAKLLTPQMAYVRRPGERYGGTKSPQERMDELLAQQIREHDDMLENRFEWMASACLKDGAITFAGENYPSQTVDFGQHADLRVATLSAGARWSQTTALPLDDIENLALDIRKKSYGAVADTIVMDGQAWNYFRKRMEGNTTQFNTQLRLGNSSLDIGPRNNVGDGQLVGELGGRFRVWVYDAYYEDDEGASQPYMPALCAMVIASGAINGRRYFGAIQDLDANLRPERMFHKTRRRWDPSGLELVSQSAPALAPRRRNAFGRLIVHQ